jgi:hypothetical protein
VLGKQTQVFVSDLDVGPYANDKVVQRILRHAKPHMTRERYIKALDPAVLAATKQMEAALDVVSSKCLPPAYQVNWEVVVSY